MLRPCPGTKLIEAASRDEVGAYGEDFERYARRVGRFIPLVGRLR